MTSSQTFELTIFPGHHRSRILALLEDFSIEDFVESAGDLDADDRDWELVFKEWSAAKDAPILVYRSTREELLPLMEAIQQEFKGEILIEEKFLPDTLWQEAWEPGFESLETEAFFIAEPKVSGGEGKVRLRLKEAQVFGSGQHATTQALIRLLEKQPRIEGRSFLDVGTGTGVLCLVAHHLGFQELCGTDIEDSAIDNARENAALNEIPIDLILGSLPTPEKKWSTIACNILPPTLTHLIADLKARLTSDGEIYLAGFNEANSAGVKSELDRLGLQVREEYSVRAWVAWRLS